MGSQKKHILLGISIQTPSFWNDIADKFMVSFKPCFLVGHVRVTVEYMAAPFPVFSKVDVFRIFEFGTVVSKDDRYRKFVCLWTVRLCVLQICG